MVMKIKMSQKMIMTLVKIKVQVLRIVKCKKHLQSEGAVSSCSKKAIIARNKFIIKKVAKF
jgi:hypothetical protein